MASLNTSFLDNLSSSQLEEITHLASSKHFKNREMLLNANPPISNVFIVKSGRVKIYDISDNGKETILWFCFPGEIFGLAELNQTNDRKVYAESCGTTELLTIRSTDFNCFLSKHNEIAIYLIELLSHRLQLLSEQLLNLSSDDVSTRLIKLLNRLSHYYGQPTDRECRLKIKLTHQEMGDMIGASRQTITSTISDLRKSGFIDKDNALSHLFSKTHFKKTKHLLQD